MAFQIDDKLVVGIASSAILDLDPEARRIFRENGVEAYRDYQRAHQQEILPKGPAFSFIRRLLNFNILFPDRQPVEVVLISHNDPDTGLRIFHSLDAYNLPISRAAFITQEAPHTYFDAYNLSLFLSKNQIDVEHAICAGYAAGTVLPSALNDDPNDETLRVAFDFDGVLTDGASETVYQTAGLEGFMKNETANAQIPCRPGPLAKLFFQLNALRQLEYERKRNDPQYTPRLQMSIVTARCAPAHERMINTLRDWNIHLDRTFFLGGINKSRILSVLKPHIFFDDQLSPHLDGAKEFVPAVHIPLKQIAADSPATP